MRQLNTSQREFKKRLDGTSGISLGVRNVTQTKTRKTVEKHFAAQKNMVIYVTMSISKIHPGKLLVLLPFDIPSPEPSPSITVVSSSYSPPAILFNLHPRSFPVTLPFLLFFLCRLILSSLNVTHHVIIHYSTSHLLFSDLNHISRKLFTARGSPDFNQHWAVVAQNGATDKGARHPVILNTP